MLRAPKVSIDAYSLNFDNGVIVAKEINFNGLLLSADFLKNSIPEVIKNFFALKNIKLKIFVKKNKRASIEPSITEQEEYYIFLSGIFYITKQEILELVSRISMLEKCLLDLSFRSGVSAIKTSIKEQYNLFVCDSIYTNFRYYWNVAKANNCCLSKITEQKNIEDLYFSQGFNEVVNIATSNDLYIKFNRSSTKGKIFFFKDLDNLIQTTNSGLMSFFISLGTINIDFQADLDLKDSTIEAIGVINLRSIDHSGLSMVIDKKVDWINNTCNSRIKCSFDKSNIYRCKSKEIDQQEDTSISSHSLGSVLPISSILPRPKF